MTVSAMLKATERLNSSAVNLGYDQGQRWTFFNRSSGAVYANKECDCSSLCGAVARLGGYNVNLSDPFYTGNFTARLKAAGFSAISCKGWTSTKLYNSVRPGDFLIGPGHVLFIYTPSKWFSAEADERGASTGGAAGDQSGKEVRLRAPYMRSRGWEFILRPPADSGGGGGGGVGGGGGQNGSTPEPTPPPPDDPKFPKTENEFIDLISPWAVDSERIYGVCAATILAQAILESGWGGSRLATEANALFGVKYSSSWPKPGNPYVSGSITMYTKEYTSSGVEYYVTDDFCAYGNWRNSLLDHGLFLNNPRYIPALEGYRSTGNIDAYCQGIHNAGYATDPEYANKLINVINTNNLRQFARLPANIPTTSATTTVPPDTNTTTTTTVPPIPPPVESMVFPTPGDWYMGPNAMREGPSDDATGWLIWRQDRGSVGTGFRKWYDRLRRSGHDILGTAVEGGTIVVEDQDTNVASIQPDQQ